MSLRRPLLIPLVLWGLAFSAPVQADFTSDYIKARKAINSGDHAEAISLLRSAISQKPGSEAKVRLYGMRFDPYVPHYYLGKALWDSGDCAGAVASFQQAMDQGVIQGLDEYSDLQRGMAACQVQSVDLTGILADAGSALNRLESANQDFGAMQSESILDNEWSSRWAPELERSGQALARLRQDLAAAESAGNPDAINAVTEAAREAANRISGSRDLAVARVGALREEQARMASQQRDQISRELAQALATARGVALPSGGNAEMQRLHGEVQTRITSAERLGTDADAQAMRSAAQDLGGLVRRYQQAEQNWRVEQQAIAARTPPPLLKQVAEAYFSGDYATTRRIANPDELADERAKVQVHLFRAAASYKLFVLSGEEATDHLRQAENDIRAIKSLNSQFSPYISAFSPRFLEFFRRTG